MPTKPISVAPLTGVLDLRSSPDLIPAGGVRMRQNFQTVGDGKLRRGCGWPKLLTSANYNNEDFHDQLLTFGASMRQPVTLIQEAQSFIGVRSLFIGQQSRLLRLSEHGGNWKVMGSGFGGTASQSCAAPRFRSARVGDYVAFTNDYDRPKYHVLEQVGESGESLYEFDDFVTIGLRRAKFVWSWRNFLIFANVEMDNQRYPFRLLGSDFEQPTSFDPEKADSITWQKDLMSHEEILGGAPSGNEFLIYTTHGIWAMTIVGGESTVNFRRCYNGEDNQMRGLLRYPGILVNLGEMHLYAAGQTEEEGRGALFMYNQFYARPERPEWLHRASSLIFDNIDTSVCEVHVAALHGNEVLISVAEEGQDNECPNVTLRINMQHQACDKVDFGFTAFGGFNSQDIQTVRDFIIESGICDLAGLTAVDANYGYENEGLPNPLPAMGAVEATCIHTLSVLHLGGTVTAAGAGTAAANGDYVWNVLTLRYENTNGYYLTTSSNGTTRTWKLFSDVPTQLYSTTATLEGLWSTVDGGAGPAPTFTADADVVRAEDYEKTASDTDSLCDILGDETIDAGCRNCPSDKLFVAAASDDWCLKQIGGAYYREECSNPTAVGITTGDGYQSAAGTYVLNGYDSIWIPGPMFTPNGGIICHNVSMQYQARPQTPPSDISLRVGVSGQIADANGDSCLVWHQHSSKKLKCQSDKTPAQHRATNTQPTTTLGWELHRKGPVLYLELKIAGTGGDVDLSRIQSELEQYEMRRI